MNNKRPISDGTKGKPEIGVKLVDNDFKTIEISKIEYIILYVLLIVLSLGVIIDN